MPLTAAEQTLANTRTFMKEGNRNGNLKQKFPGTFDLSELSLGCKQKVFFESDGLSVHLHHGQASGNPVRIGDGCATVTGYKLPQPLVSRLRDREGGSEVGSPKSGYRFVCARRGPAGAGPTSPSKRRMRPVPEPFSGGI